MKNKFFILVVLSFLLFLFSPKPTLAQGTCGCARGADMGICDNITNNCDSGYTPQCQDSTGNTTTLCSNYARCVCTSAPPPPPPPPPGSQPINFTNLISVTLPNIGSLSMGQIIGRLLPYVFQAAGLLLLIYLVYSGYEVMVSQSDPKRIASGQQKITNALIGFVIIFVSYWLVRLTGEILNIQAIRDIFQ